MVNPSEETLESEIGFDYSYNIDYTYGVSGAIFRSVTGYSNTIQGDTSRVASYNRTPTGFTNTILGDTSRVATYNRSSTGFTNTIWGDVARVASYNRTPTGFTDPIYGDTNRQFTDWEVDGISFFIQDLNLDHKRMSLSGQTGGDISLFNDKFSRVGDYSVKDESDGEFRAIDEANQSKKNVRPPAEDTPEPFDDFKGYIESYSTTEIGGAGRHEIDISIQRDSNRNRNVSDPSETGFWEIEFSLGTIGLEENQVKIAPLQGNKIDGEWSLPLLLLDSQARLAMESLSHADAVTERDIPDAANTFVDTTSDNKNTITLTPPSKATIPSGTYIVKDWKLEFHESRKWWQLDLTLVE